MTKSLNLLQPKEEEKMLENLNLRIENEFLQKRLTFKEKEVEELKARVEALSKTLAELKEKQEVDTIISEKEEAIVEQLWRLYQKNRTRRKEGKKAEGILPLKRKTMPSTSDDVKELALSFENLAPISDPGMKRIDASKKLPGLSFLGNIFPTEDGPKETTSTSVESVPSTKKVPDEAFVLHEFPFLNIPPPDSPRMLSKRPILCEECNKHHVPYYYCFNQPCSACYSKDHHFIKCPYLRYIPKGVDFNRDVYEVGCGCGNLFDEEEWLLISRFYSGEIN